MTDIHRICASCGKEVAVADRICPACGMDTQSENALMESATALQRLQNAAPALLAAGFVAVRIGLALARAPWFQAALRLAGGRARTSVPATKSRGQNPVRRIHIRSRWIIREAGGRQRQGEEEHTIDLS